jgi:hypothetical protein
VPISLAKTLLVGVGIGIAAACLLILVIHTYVLPDALQASVTLVLVLGAFSASNLLQPESGLLTITVMGIALANQKRVHLEHIVEFKENLRVLLLSSVFVLLSARLRMEDVRLVGAEILLFVLVLILIARPLCVMMSTARSVLSIKERLFLMCMAPRGIVAAAIASVFALTLEEQGEPQARLLLPITFATIVGTVLFYGLTAGPIASALKLAERNPQGMLIAGAGPFARRLAEAMQAIGVRVVLVDTNRDSVTAARMAGLQAFHGSILGSELIDAVDLSGIGRFFALTTNDGVNGLAAQRLRPLFGSRNIYQIGARAAPPGRPELSGAIKGRVLFGSYVHLSGLEQMLLSDWVIKSTPLTTEFDYKTFRNITGAGSCHCSFSRKVNCPSCL